MSVPSVLMKSLRPDTHPPGFYWMRMRDGGPDHGWQPALIGYADGRAEATVLGYEAEVYDADAEIGTPIAPPPE